MKSFIYFVTLRRRYRHHLILSSARHDGVKRDIIKSLKINEDVQSLWFVLSSELDDNLSVMLLDMIIELYVTIRGFAFANSCMELYKQSKKQTLYRNPRLQEDKFMNLKVKANNSWTLLYLSIIIIIIITYA